MSDYPRLTEMGVRNPLEIEKFAIYTVGNTDILRIIYDRKKGSLLPVSKSFKFPQAKNSVIVDSGTRQTQIVYESTDTFQHALVELEELLENQKTEQQLNQVLADEILQLEAEIASRIDYIKSLVEKRK